MIFLSLVASIQMIKSVFELRDEKAQLLASFQQEKVQAEEIKQIPKKLSLLSKQSLQQNLSKEIIQISDANSISLNKLWFSEDKEVPSKLVVRGDYKNILHFLNQIMLHVKYLQLSQMNLSKKNSLLSLSLEFYLNA